MSPAADFTVLDTRGKLYAHGHGIGGYCLICQRIFDVSIVALIKERGGDARVVGVKPRSPAPAARGGARHSR